MSDSNPFDAVTEFKDAAIDWAVNYAPRIVGALVILIIGIIIINFIIRIIRNRLKKSDFDKTLASFLLSLISWLLKLLVFLMVI